MAQGKVISGTVEDAMGPVMMANVVERDANKRIVNATQTDMMGNFSMEIKNPKNKLVVSYVGSKTFETVIGDKETFAIKLEDEKTTLSEITVRGRRTTAGGLNIDKREITGAQSTFNLQDVEGMAFTSADEALQGEIAGLDIVANSGNLGAGTSMKLRGSSGEPLIVVDDKIFEYNTEDIDLDEALNGDNEAFSSLLAVNVDDIASITVLKDAAATAIWGSRGADGVIQITTKRGQRGKPKMALSYKFTGGWMPSGYKMLNGDNYTMMLKEALFNRYRKADATTGINEINYPTPQEWPDANNWNRNTDWVDEVKQFSQQHEANFNINGGGQKASFRISGGFKSQTGTIIKQKLNQLTTRLVLDYNVSDRIRFSTNFALTYTDNLKNYTIGSSKDNSAHNAILAMAFAMAPNVAINRTDQYGNEYEYFLMNRADVDNKLESKTSNGITSWQLNDVVKIGNPVAYANQAWQKEQTYSITPDFNLKYELLGTGSDQTRLTANARVYFDIYANSKPTFRPASLSNDYYSSSYNNFAADSENNQFKLGARAELIFTPHFKNEDFSLTMLARYEFIKGKYTYQYVAENQLPTGIESSSATAQMVGLDNHVATTKSADHNWIYNAHFSYKGRYNLGFSLRGDGSSKYGPETPWFISPSVSLRYNVSDEPFFKPLQKYISMLGLRGSWGINGSQSAKVENYFNQYSISTTPYITGVAGGYSTTLTTMSGLKLDALKPQKKEGINFGVNLGLLDDMIEFDLDIYKNTTRDMIMRNVPIPTSAAWGGVTTLAYGNMGKMKNQGWELTIRGNKFIKYKKFSVSAQFNLGQDANKLLEMDERVLEGLNSIPAYSHRGSASLYQKVEINKPLNSIYGYNYKGVYQYSYEFLTNYNLRMKQSNSNWTTADYENQINQWLAEGKTFPVVVGADGKVVMSGLEPQRMKYFDGDTNYYFEGGDAMYEDTNHDGNINEQDMVYLGNSRPKLQGGFSFTFAYGNWKLVTRFTYRTGFDVVNIARMNLENMYGTTNQCASTTHRWRKDGDGGSETVLPRALYGDGYNWQMSSRYVEDGSFLRFQNIQLSYTFPKKQIKKWGLSNLTAYVTMNRLFTLTKYSGLDPEHAPGLYNAASDSNSTPVNRSVTASINIGF